MSSEASLVEADALSKCYFLRFTAKNVKKAPHRVFWALKDVSFRIGRSETVALIGRNGCGKSTLLQILSRVKAPTSGSASLTDRVCSILGLGLGFRQDLSARENVYFSGALFGLTRRVVKDRFDSIVSLAGVEGFIDEPLRTFSQGMQMRLAFATALHTDAELLLLDEVFSVGDALFQRKCMEELTRFSRRGGSLFLAVHNTAWVRRYATRVIYLDEGRIVKDGDPLETAAAYDRNTVAAKTELREDLAAAHRDLPLSATRILSVQLDSAAGPSIQESQPFAIRVTFDVAEGGPLEATFFICTLEGSALIASSFSQAGRSQTLLPGRWEVSSGFAPNRLVPGFYLLRIVLRVGEATDSVPRALVFEVGKSSGEKALGAVRAEWEWRDPVRTL